MKTRIIPIDEIVCKQELYPRTQVSWYVEYKYSEAMKAGANFPPIVVALLKGKYILVDGWHRIHALKKNGETHVQAEILKGFDQKQIYIEAIKRNVVHGLPLSAYELRRAAILMQKWKIEPIVISQITRVPLGKMELFVSKSITNIATGEKIALKKPLGHLSALQGSEEFLEGTMQKVDVTQNALGGKSQVDLIDELILLVESNLIDTKNEDVQTGLKHLYTLLGKVLKASTIHS